MKYPVITICGSMRYYDDMLKAAETLTAHGYVVLMPFVADYADGQPEDDRKVMLDEMHRQKIDMSDAIVIIGEHRGESTVRESNYAFLKRMPIFQSVKEVLA